MFEGKVGIPLKSKEGGPPLCPDEMRNKRLFLSCGETLGFHSCCDGYLGEPLCCIKRFNPASQFQEST